MNLILFFEPFSVAVGIFVGILLCVLLRSKKSKLNQEAIVNHESELEAIKDNLYEQMVDYVNEQEKAHELIGHYNYKTKELGQKINCNEAIRKKLKDEEQELLKRSKLLNKQEEEIKAQLRRKDDELKGARARARRLLSKKDDLQDSEDY